MPTRVTVWGENVHERRDESVRMVYPNGMHTAVADGITEHLRDRVVVRTATLEQPQHGLTEEVLDGTDVLTWWGHAAHDAVDDAVVARVHDRVLAGMGLLALHSAHYSKLFRRLMGTSCTLRWRNDGERELVWTVDPSHPIAVGVPHRGTRLRGERDCPAGPSRGHRRRARTRRRRTQREAARPDHGAGPRDGRRRRPRRSAPHGQPEPPLPAQPRRLPTDAPAARPAREPHLRLLHRPPQGA